MSQDAYLSFSRLLTVVALCIAGMAIPATAAAQGRPPLSGVSVPSDPCDSVWQYLERDDIFQGATISVNGPLEAYSPVGITSIVPVRKKSFLGGYGFAAAMGSRAVDVSLQRALVARNESYRYSGVVQVCGDGNCTSRYTMSTTPTECIVTERGATVLLRDDANDYTAVIYIQNLLPLIGG